MKKLSAILLVTITSLSVNAQFYEFTMRTETYNEFEGSTLSPPTWDDQQGTLPMPFDFYLFGEFVNEITVFDEFYTFSESGNHVAYFTALGADLKSRGSDLSPIAIDVAGETPNTIVKAQLKNGGFVGDNTGKDYVNYQVWIYETTNVIEIHYGESSINNAAGSFNGETGPVVGIQKADLTKALGLTGNPQSPTQYDETAGADMYLNGVPSSGTVYTFTPRKYPLGVNLVSKAISFNTYPNPFKNSLKVELKNTEKADLIIVNSLGETVLRRQVFEGKTEVSTKDLTAGVYFVKIISESSIITRKVLKADI